MPNQPLLNQVAVGSLDEVMRHRFRFAPAAVAGLLGFLALAVVTGRVQGRQEAELVRETIVYSSIQPSNWDLYLFESPGSSPRRLTTDRGLDYNGVISPDGRWVVFTSERTGNPDLYVLDLQGHAEVRPLVESPAMEDAAAISPDGRRLLFVSTRSGNADVFVLPFQPEDPPAASEARNLTRHPAGDYNPAFSPDGTRILFSSSRDTSVATVTGASLPPTYLASELYVMQTDGTDVRRLTQHENWDGAPAWTPDGQAVVFYSQRDGEPRIYRTGIDGSGPSRSPRRTKRRCRRPSALTAGSPSRHTGTTAGRSSPPGSTGPTCESRAIPRATIGRRRTTGSRVASWRTDRDRVRRRPGSRATRRGRFSSTARSLSTCRTAACP